uniref:Uncharacterized protein n=1 Tax=Anguilla anguilla TaxID=7936 RepID=A0A0E9X5C2_ANGAN
MKTLVLPLTQSHAYAHHMLGLAYVHHTHTHTHSPMHSTGCQTPETDWIRSGFLPPTTLLHILFGEPGG